MMKKLNLLLVFFMMTLTVVAQDFEGAITYTIQYKDLPAEMQGMEQMLPKEQKILVKGEKSKFEQSTAMSETTVISDMTDGTSMVLISAQGQKFKITLNKEEVDKSIQQQGEAQITYVSGTKEILGYTCKKAEVTMEGMTDPAIFYYTEDIPMIKMRGMESIELKGMPLEYEMTMQGMHMIVTVTEMNQQTLSDSEFIAPDGYQEMNDQMKAMFGIK
jgi:GLPGLI family protein